MVGQAQSPWVGQKKKVFNSEMAWNITRTNLLVSNNVRYDVQEKVLGFDTVPLYILLVFRPSVTVSTLNIN